MKVCARRVRIIVPSNEGCPRHEYSHPRKPQARGPARELLQKIVLGDHVLVTSIYLLQEVRRVLAYSRIEARWQLRPHEIAEYLQILASISEVVVPHPGIPIIPRDVDDDPILYTALAGRAGVLCTLDAHFYEESVKSFCVQRHIGIMDDVALLRLIRSNEE